MSKPVRITVSSGCFMLGDVILVGRRRMRVIWIHDDTTFDAIPTLWQSIKDWIRRLLGGGDA